MDTQKLFHLLELPDDVVIKLNEYAKNRTIQIDDTLKQMIFKRENWDEGVQKMQELLGQDDNGIKILWEQLNMACISYDVYMEKGISEDIFIATMKFCTRFLKEHQQTYGNYKFVWAWWFPRQISLNEFRIGALEYEFAEGEENKIFIHIPSDADLSKESVMQSLQNFYRFRNTFFPDWNGTRLFCDSWLLSPTLKIFLKESSNILAFQNLFELEDTDYEAMWFMDWVFPGYQHITNNLPEKTSLQRQIKKYLLEGNKIGCSKGYLKNIYLESNTSL